MNNKTKTYALIIAVLIVWGVIGYKIINSLSTDKSQTISQEFDMAFEPKQIKEVERFSIQNIERDPFLGTLANNKRRPSSTSRTSKQKPIDNSPIITYGGLVKKQNAEDQVFVVNINNQQYLLKKGQIADSIKLERGNTKEIIIRYNNKLQTIKRH